MEAAVEMALSATFVGRILAKGELRSIKQIAQSFWTIHAACDLRFQRSHPLQNTRFLCLKILEVNIPRQCVVDCCFRILQFDVTSSPETL
jgi:hypothetical protein